MRYVVKLAMFAAFVALLYFAVGIVINMASSFISEHFTIGNNAIYIMHRLKLCEAVNLYISLVIATWITNKIINYWM